MHALTPALGMLLSCTRSSGCCRCREEEHAPLRPSTSTALNGVRRSPACLPSTAPAPAEWLKPAVGLLLPGSPRLMQRSVCANFCSALAAPGGAETGEADARRRTANAAPLPKAVLPLPALLASGASSCPPAPMAPAGSSAGSEEGINREVRPRMACCMRASGLEGWAAPPPGPGLSLRLLPALLLAGDR